MILEELTLEGPNGGFKAESDQLEGNIGIRYKRL